MPRVKTFDQMLNIQHHCIGHLAVTRQSQSN